MLNLSGLMIHAIDVQRATASKDAIGGPTRLWSTLTSGIPCRIQPLRGWKTDEYLRNDMHVTHRIYFANNPLLQNGDRLYMPSQNRTFEVRAFWDTEEIGVLFVADCEELNRSL